MIGTLDPTLTDVSIAKDLKDSFVIRRRGKEIIIQDGKLLNRELLSSGTAEGIDVAVFLASMASAMNCFYYCDEHFSYIQSDIEKRIFDLMVERSGMAQSTLRAPRSAAPISPRTSPCSFIASVEPGANKRQEF